MLLHSQNMSVTYIENVLEAIEGEIPHIRVKNGNISHFKCPPPQNHYISGVGSLFTLFSLINVFL